MFADIWAIIYRILYNLHIRLPFLNIKRKFLTNIDRPDSIYDFELYRCVARSFFSQSNSGTFETDCLV